MKIKKKIVFLTGTRADFGKLRPLIEITENSDEFECHIFVTGMHTLSRYDFTYREVEKRGYKNVFVFTNQNDFENTDIILANTIKGFSNFVNKISPDMIVIHGDRLEALAGAIVGSFNNILVSHIEGGELTGTIDESIRHAVSKLSHIHFVSNEYAKKRLVQMGEIEKRIFVIGSPDIDIMVKKDLPTKEGLKKYYDMQFEKYAILIFHPVTTELDDLENQTNELVSGAIDSKRNYVIIYPNNDPGSEIILNVYKKLENNANFRIYPSLRFEYFLTLLKNADFIIGNSSSGIIEAEIYSVPTINVGTRQKNRSSNESIMNVESKKEKILDSISKVDSKEIKSSFSFGDGKSTKRFFDVILSEKIWNVSIQKQFVENYE